MFSFPEHIARKIQVCKFLHFLIIHAKNFPQHAQASRAKAWSSSILCLLLILLLLRQLPYVLPWKWYKLFFLIPLMMTSTPEITFKITFPIFSYTSHFFLYQILKKILWLGFVRIKVEICRCGASHMLHENCKYLIHCLSHIDCIQSITPHSCLYIKVFVFVLSVAHQLFFSVFDSVW